MRASEGEPLWALSPARLALGGRPRGDAGAGQGYLLAHMPTGTTTAGYNKMDLGRLTRTQISTLKSGPKWSETASHFNPLVFIDCRSLAHRVDAVCLTIAADIVVKYIQGKLQ